MHIDLGTLVVVSLLAYGLAFLIIGIITVLPMAIVKTRKRAVERREEKTIVEAPTVATEQSLLIAIAAAAAKYVHRLKSLKVSQGPPLLMERTSWHLRSRMEYLRVHEIPRYVRRR